MFETQTPQAVAFYFITQGFFSGVFFLCNLCKGLCNHIVPFLLPPEQCHGLWETVLSLLLVSVETQWMLNSLAFSQSLEMVLDCWGSRCNPFWSVSVLWRDTFLPWSALESLGLSLQFCSSGPIKSLKTVKAGTMKSVDSLVERAVIWAGTDTIPSLEFLWHKTLGPSSWALRSPGFLL